MGLPAYYGCSDVGDPIPRARRVIQHLAAEHRKERRQRPRQWIVPGADIPLCGEVRPIDDAFIAGIVPVVRHVESPA